jgi:drug/metabolite transporter (DMT)-like permease
MYDLELGVACACVASILFDLGVALQALEARDVSHRHALRPSLIRRLIARPRWVFATLLAAAGWPLHVVALLLAPLTVVQPALASGLLLLLVLGDRMLGERVGPLEIGAVLAIVAGVIGMAWAAPDHTSHHAGALRLGLTLGALGLLALAPYVSSRREAAAASALLPLSAGCAYAWTGISSKLLADYLSSSMWPAVLAWAAATGAVAFFGLLSEMSALQRRPATRVVPVVFVAQITIPVLLAPLITGENWASTPLGGAVLVGFLALVAAGAGALGRSAAVSGLVAAGADQLGEGYGAQPAGGKAAVQ